ncbi:unnamed protein product [Polarella glacialis]|uniref:Uncharacterized protein n=1 Tax=Polarella glacialis TaxID=89957 RepID=A0A813EZ34_POLGL|nr:unnamed protein product [Polarella glacialis]
MAAALHQATLSRDICLLRRAKVWVQADQLLAWPHRVSTAPPTVTNSAAAAITPVTAALLDPILWLAGPLLLRTEFDISGFAIITASGNSLAFEFRLSPEVEKS